MDAASLIQLMIAASVVATGLRESVWPTVPLSGTVLNGESVSHGFFLETGSVDL